MSLTRGSANPFNLDRMMVTFGSRLTHAKEEDYLAISGLPVLNALALTMWLEKFPSCNLLQWSMKKKSYVPIILSKAAVVKNATEDPNRPAD